MAVGLVGFATADESVQKEVASLKPKKINKKKPQNVSLKNTVITEDEPGKQQPKSAERTIVFWPKQMKFNTKAIRTCKTDESGLETAATTEEAIEMCGKKSMFSKPKGSVAEVRVDLGPGSDPLVIPVEVTGFNENGKKVLLYSKPSGDFSGIPANILVGKLKKASAVAREVGVSASPFKQALDVTIPSLDAGAISFFQVVTTKTKFIQAKCKPKKLTFRATTFFEDGTDTTDDHKFKCKPKG